MNDDQVISWIFLATALATQKEPTDFSGISMVADGINHAVPSHQELQGSISFLVKHKLVERLGKKYKLAAKGNIDFEAASKKSDKILEIWKDLEGRIKYYR